MGGAKKQILISYQYQSLWGKENNPVLLTMRKRKNEQKCQ
jgi:hypothetical protein